MAPGQLQGGNSCGDGYGQQRRQQQSTGLSPLPHFVKKAAPCIQFYKEGILLAVSRSENGIKILANAEGTSNVYMLLNYIAHFSGTSN
ncbi:hypothetical protein SO802_005855 [Lithocarpus litseifolius]|uniref:Uncharacterized protein n=1 Tax=Lithocarpus litseifolius TaxID=425828 RepID=A0AAW2DJA7_9ROSI